MLIARGKHGRVSGIVERTPDHLKRVHENPGPEAETPLLEGAPSKASPDQQGPTLGAGDTSTLVEAGPAEDVLPAVLEAPAADAAPLIVEPDLTTEIEAPRRRR